VVSLGVAAQVGRQRRIRGDDGSAEYQPTDSPGNFGNPALSRWQGQLPAALYQFGGGGEHHEGFSRIFTEEIVAREIPYIDTEGRVTEVRLLWSVGGWTAPNWTHSRLEGLPLNIGKDTPGHDAEGEGIVDQAIYELVQTVPLPRRFIAKVWGPRGDTVQYSFQLIRSNTPIPEDEFERWDDNQSRNYIVALV